MESARVLGRLISIQSDAAGGSEPLRSARHLAAACASVERCTAGGSTGLLPAWGLIPEPQTGAREHGLDMDMLRGLGQVQAMTSALLTSDQDPDVQVLVSSTHFCCDFHCDALPGCLRNKRLI